MLKFEVNDEAIISASPKAVFKAILDEYSGVSRLWLPDIEFKPRGDNPMDCVGSTCDTTVRSHGLTGRFSETVVAIEPEKSLEFKLSGEFSGSEKWTFELMQGEKTKTTVSWKGESSKLLLAIVSPFISVEKELHKSRREFLKKLETRFSERRHL